MIESHKDTVFDEGCSGDIGPIDEIVSYGLVCFLHGCLAVVRHPLSCFITKVQLAPMVPVEADEAVVNGRRGWLLVTQ